VVKKQKKEQCGYKPGSVPRLVPLWGLGRGACHLSVWRIAASVKQSTPRHWTSSPW